MKLTRDVALIEALGLEKGGVVSIVGAGGKTSLMYRLAKDLAHTGAPVLTTTTTKIYKPDKSQSTCLIVSSDTNQLLREATEALKRHTHITAAPAKTVTKQRKLTGFPPMVVDRIAAAGVFRWILVEADGAAGHHLKIPAPHEPVIPQSSNWVVGLIGLKSVGKPLTAKWVFRLNRYAAVTGLNPGQTITPASVATSLSAAKGILQGHPLDAKCIAFLNMADHRSRLTYARQIVWHLKKSSQTTHLHRVVIGKTLHHCPVIEYYDL
jgi:probable selenium-dependent hydroxylase accessory protein YqeC